jgi:hypothetical protein
MPDKLVLGALQPLKANNSTQTKTVHFIASPSKNNLIRKLPTHRLFHLPLAVLCDSTHFPVTLVWENPGSRVGRWQHTTAGTLRLEALFEQAAQNMGNTRLSSGSPLDRGSVLIEYGRGGESPVGFLRLSRLAKPKPPAPSDPVPAAFHTGTLFPGS